MLLGNKRKALPLEDGEEEEHVSKRPNLGLGSNGPIPIMINGVHGMEPAMQMPQASGIVPTPDFIRPAVINPIMSVSQVRLAVPKIRSHILRSLDRGTLPPAKGTNGTNGVEESMKASEDIIIIE